MVTATSCYRTSSCLQHLLCSGLLWLLYNGHRLWNYVFFSIYLHAFANGPELKGRWWCFGQRRQWLHLHGAEFTGNSWDNVHRNINKGDSLDIFRYNNRQIFIAALGLIKNRRWSEQDMLHMRSGEIWPRPLIWRIYCSYWKSSWDL